MANKSVSTIQAKAPLTGATLLLVASVPIKVLGIEGVVTSTTGTNYYIQLLGTASPVSGTTIPLYSRLVVPSTSSSGQNGFSFEYPFEGLDTQAMNFPAGGTTTTDGFNTLPVYAAISTTDTVWTSVAASTDVTVTFEEWQYELPNQTITGDTVTGVDLLPVYTSPNTAKRLTKFQVTNNNGATCYLMLFAYSNPAAGATPIAQWTLANGVTLTETFGGGLAPLQYPVVGGTQDTGCFLFGSSTTQTLTATSATSWTMKAWNI